MKPAPAVSVTTHRPLSTAVVTVEAPLASSGASKTMWRAADPPGTE